MILHDEYFYKYISLIKVIEVKETCRSLVLQARGRGCVLSAAGAPPAVRVSSFRGAPFIRRAS